MRTHIKLLSLVLCVIMIMSLDSFGAGDRSSASMPSLHKMAAREHRKEGIHDGNNILTIFFNYGCIGNWFADSDRLSSGIWPKGSGHSYFAEFTPFVGAETRDRSGTITRIFSDGIGDPGMADMAPGGEYQYSFEPVQGYADDDQDRIAMYNGQGSEDNDGPDNIPAYMNSEDDDGKPDSWPWVWPDRPDWVDPRTGVPFWNGQYGAYNRATQESYFRMNDFANDEWNFFPDPADSSKRGLAVEVEARGYQWADPAAEDIIIYTYWISNVGKTLYEKMVFGMYGDADIGESVDNDDDLSEFNQDQDIVYQYDSIEDSWSSADGGFRPGYFGWKFLESPSDPRNGKDDDGDGLIGADGNPWDESQEDGIDNDEDWDPEIDDVGSDGKGPDHPDYAGPDSDGSEGNGIPDRGEPNFEYTDNDEADQIGLTSFKSAKWKSGIDLADDKATWLQTVPGSFSKPASRVDIVMHYGSGYFELPPYPDPDSRRKFAISMVMGYDRDDLVRNALTMQEIYDHDYNFAAVPLKPKVTAVPGDGKVTLYWDKSAERSRDPIYGYDFEGYIIYRSTDPGFLESYVGTDTYGNPAFNKPIAQFDLDDGLKGPHPVGRDGVQFNMGSDTGLEYTFTDSGQTYAGAVNNGQTYYYAVCSYDKGYYDNFFIDGLSSMDSLQAKAPAICEKKIQFDASGEVTFLDVNTVQIVANAPSAGYQEPPELNTDNGWVEKLQGDGTGSIIVQPLDPMKIIDGNTYEITFNDSTVLPLDGTEELIVDTTFTVLDLSTYTRTVKIDTEWTSLKQGDLVPNSIRVTLQNSDITYEEGVDYEVGYEIGNFRALPGGSMPQSTDENIYYADVQYQYYPVLASPYIKGEDANPYFNGLRVLVNNPNLWVSEQRSQWLEGDERQSALAQYDLIGENDPIPEKYQGTSNYNYDLNLYPNQGVPVPHDFRIVIYDEVVVQDVQKHWANFRIFNVTTGDTAEFIFFDNNKDSLLTDQDKVLPITRVGTRLRGTWQVIFRAPKDSVVMIDSLDANGNAVENAEGEVIQVPIDTILVDKIAPKPGDIFYMAIDKPFTRADKYQFTAKAPYVDQSIANDSRTLENIAVVPNPYVVTASWEPQHFYSSGRGIRKIDFIHLPPKCTIKIFTLRGYLVDTIEHDSEIIDGSEPWNMLSKDEMEIAFGVYIYHVETPSGESTIGKFAVIK